MYPAYSASAIMILIKEILTNNVHGRYTLYRTNVSGAGVSLSHQSYEIPMQITCLAITAVISHVLISLR